MIASVALGGRVLWSLAGFNGGILTLPSGRAWRILRRYAGKVWHRASWISNPFNLRDPIQFFHFGAIITIAQGVVILARVLLTSFPFYVEVVPLAMGLGVWVGVKVVVVLYRSTFAV